MMNAVFCHDQVFVEGGAGAVYSEGYFGATFWQRYLGAFDTLTVVGRSRPLADGEALEGLNVVSADRVSFTFVPNFESATGLVLRRRQAMTIIAEAVRRADLVIARLRSGVGGLAVREARRQRKPYAAEF